jgi:hypothetical protein
MRLGLNRFAAISAGPAAARAKLRRAPSSDHHKMAALSVPIEVLCGKRFVLAATG